MHAATAHCILFFAYLSLEIAFSMTTAHFTSLDTDNQLNALYFEGHILANRYEDDFIYLLYSLNSFYVEVRHEAYTNQVKQISAFKSTDKLEPYLPYLTEIAQ